MFSYFLTLGAAVRGATERAAKPRVLFCNNVPVMNFWVFVFEALRAPSERAENRDVLK
jgi:hypothetical protein